MSGKSPYRYFEPFFYSGLFDDPIMVIRVKPLASNILVDCGKIHHLTKRILKAVDTVFITHAHMDHFMGFDTFIRSVLVSSKTINIFGPPYIAIKLEHKLKGYDWNLVEDYYCSFRVFEISVDRIDTYLLEGSNGFSVTRQNQHPRRDKIIYENSHFFAEADLCNHTIPVLIFKFTEKSGFAVDEGKIAKLGLVKGPWLEELKAHFHNPQKKAPHTIRVLVKKGTGIKEVEFNNPQHLYASIRKDFIPASIGYISDIGFTAENIETVLSLMKDVTLLVSECTYLKSEINKARSTLHLCSNDLNALLEKLTPQFFMPMHLSTTYLQNPHLLYSEIKAPGNCTVLKLPPRLTPHPILPDQLPKLFASL